MKKECITISLYQSKQKKRTQKWKFNFKTLITVSLRGEGITNVIVSICTAANIILKVYGTHSTPTLTSCISNPLSIFRPLCISKPLVSLRVNISVNYRWYISKIIINNNFILLLHKYIQRSSKPLLNSCKLKSVYNGKKHFYQKLYH